MIRNVYIIDRRISGSYDFLQNLQPDSAYHFLDADRDGVSAILDIVSSYTDLSSLHLISHGAEGVLYLGNAALSLSSLPEYEGRLAGIGTHLSPGADLLIYGGNVASGPVGQAFITQLAQATGADVAASTDATGGAVAGADGVLEASVGTIEAATLPLADLVGTLGTGPTVTPLQGSSAQAPSLSGTAVVGSGQALKVIVADQAYTTANGVVLGDNGSWTLALPKALAAGTYDVKVIVSDLPVVPAVADISGTNAADTALTGVSGSTNRITGRGGDDLITGKGRADMAVYSGNQADYTVSRSGSSVIVKDNRSGSPDGTDTLKGINLLQFADRAVFLEAAANRVFLAGGEQTHQLTNNAVVMGSGDVEHFVVTPSVSSAVYASNGDVVDLARAIDDYQFTASGTKLQISDGTYLTVVNLGGTVTLRTASGATTARIDYASGGKVVLGGNQVVGSSEFNPLKAITNASDRSANAQLQVSDQTTAELVVVVAETTTGTVIDGYISGATVFADADNDGVLDQGEISTTTDNQGAYSFATDVRGMTLVSIGGTDTSTNQSFTTVLKAAAGSSVITPMTTLVAQQMKQDASLSLSDAQARVLQAFGLDSGIDLRSYDPLAVLNNASASADEKAKALNVQKVSAQVANTFIASYKDAGQDTAQAAANVSKVMDNLSAMVKAHGANAAAIDLGDADTIASALSNAVAAGHGSIHIDRLASLNTTIKTASGLQDVVKSQVLSQGDFTAPTLSGNTPADNATAVAVGDNILLTFSEAVQAGTGNIVISNGTDTRTILITDSSQVTISGTTVTINPTADLQTGSSYSVQLASGVIKDLAGNAYAGISDATTLNFTTAAVAPTFVATTLSATNGSAVGLTEAEAISLYLVNQARHAPQVWADMLGVTLNQDYLGHTLNAAEVAAKDSLVLDGELIMAARGHSAHMLATDQFAHANIGDGTPDSRATDAGYDWASVGENINWAQGSSVAPENVAKESVYGLFIDDGIAGAGHRTNLLGADFADIGIGYAIDEVTPKYYGTENPGSNPTEAPHLTGFVLRNSDGNYQYNGGEGLSGVTITIVDTTANKTYTTQTIEQGYWHFAAVAGHAYTVTASGGEFTGTGTATNVVLASGGSNGSNSRSIDFFSGTSWGRVDYAVEGNHMASGQVAIAGSATPGGTLTVDSSAVQDLDGKGSLSYQWYVNGEALSDVFGNGSVSGSSASLVLNDKLAANVFWTTAKKAADLAGQVFTVKATYTDQKGALEAVPGSNSVTVAAAVADTTAPTVTSITHDTNDGNLALGETLTLTVVLSEAVVVTGTPTIALDNGGSASYTGGTGTPTLTFSYTPAAGQNSADLVTAASNALVGTIKDLAGNAVVAAGFNNVNPAGTLAVDVSAPTLASSTPADNATAVAVGSDIVLNFSENVALGSSGTIRLYKADNTLVETFDVSGSLTGKVTVSGMGVTINPGADLANGTAYYLKIDSGAIKDGAGNAYAGIGSATTLNFTTVLAQDTTAPTLVSSTPADNATAVAVGSDIALNFSENVALGSSGTIKLYQANGTLVETFDVSGNLAGKVTVAGTGVTLNPTALLASETGYYVTIASGAIRDLAGNAYAGIGDAATLNFTSGAAVAPTFVATEADPTQASALTLYLINEIRRAPDIAKKIYGFDFGNAPFDSLILDKTIDDGATAHAAQQLATGVWDWSPLQKAGQVVETQVRCNGQQMTDEQIVSYVINDLKVYNTYGNLLSASYTDAGFGYAIGGANADPTKNYAFYSIQDLASLGSGGYTAAPHLTGFVLNDGNANRQFNGGEGMSGVRIDIVDQSTGEAWYTFSKSNGYWDFAATAGHSYTVTASGGAFAGIATVANVAIDTGGSNGNNSRSLDFFSGVATGRLDYQVPGNHVPTGTLTLSGAAEVGRSITATLSGLTDVDGVGALTLRWLVDGKTMLDVPLSGADLTSTFHFNLESWATFAAVAGGSFVHMDHDYVGHAISAQVYYTDQNGSYELISAGNDLGKVTDATVQQALARLNDSTYSELSVSDTADNLLILANSINNATDLTPFKKIKEFHLQGSDIATNTVNAAQAAVILTAMSKVRDWNDCFQPLYFHADGSRLYVEDTLDNINASLSNANQRSALMEWASKVTITTSGSMSYDNLAYMLENYADVTVIGDASISPTGSTSGLTSSQLSKIEGLLGNYVTVAEINSQGDRIVLTLTKELSTTTADPSSFVVNVKDSWGTTTFPVAVTDVVVNGKTVELSLDRHLNQYETASVVYTDPTSGDDSKALQSVTGKDVASFSGVSVTNTSLATIAINAEVAGTAAGEVMNGTSGNDQLYALGGADTLSGGAGNDILDAGYKTTTASAVSETTGNLVHGDDGDDELYGGAGNDKLYGDAGADFIYAYKGNDLLYGGDGNDVLYGSSDNDVLVGGQGKDMLVGGSGSNTFVFDSALSASGNVDTISDFVSAEDHIQLVQSVFSALSVGVLSADQFHVGTAAQDADDRILYDAATGTLSYDADGNGSSAAVQFATLANKPALTAADLAVIGTPTLQGVTTIAGGNAVTLSFSQALGLNLPGAAAFDVVIDGAHLTPTQLAANGSELTLTLGQTINAGQTITVAYAAPVDASAAAIQDFLGVQVASFTATPVAYLGDVTPPTLISAETSTDGTKIILTYNEALSGVTAAPQDFDLLVIDAGDNFPMGRQVSQVSVNGNTIELLLDRPVANGRNTVGVAYTDPTAGNDAAAIQDSAGNDAADFSDGIEVTNKVTKLTPVYGTSAAETFNGTAGNDEIYANTGSDTLNGGDGNDILDAGYWGSEAHSGKLSDSSVNDVHGGNGDDEIYGRNGADQLWGDAGDDLIYGSSGNDTIYGGAGNDYLSGGNGNNTFVFDTALSAATNVDTIDDFWSILDGGADKIQLDHAVFSTLSAGALTAAQLHVGTAAQDADDRIVYDSASGKLYYDADGNGAGIAVQFAQLVGGPTLSALDFAVL